MKIKDCFVSRFVGGQIVEFDYSQLEVIVLAALTQDKVLIEELQRGEDRHVKTYCEVTGENYQDLLYDVNRGDTVALGKRWNGKKINFMKIYGAGAASMHRDTGLSLPAIKRYLKFYDQKYTGIKAYNDANMAMLKRTKNTDGDGMLQTSYGRWWKISHRWSDYSNDYEFPPSVVSNYPIQGTAAELMHITLGNMKDLLYNLCIWGKFVMINTIHDSVFFDVHPDYLVYLKDVKKVMEKVTDEVKDEYDIHFPVPLEVSCSIGDTWGSIKPVNVEDY